MKTELFFSDNYAQAQSRFRVFARLLGWELNSYPIDGRGPAGEELTIDVAIAHPAGLQNEAPCLVVSSGLHGIEAFFGSAVQCAVMQSWVEKPHLAPPFRCVFIHPLNPYGFAWLRRTNESNIDLNRNFLLDKNSYHGSPAGYADFDELLNPKHAPGRWETFVPQALMKIARFGLPAVKNAVAGGQYDFPQGLFYGGNMASDTNKLLDMQLARWLDGSSQILHFDLHSGLGRWGSYKLIVDYPLKPEQRLRFTSWFGDSNLEEDHASAPKPRVSYQTSGGLGQWCVAMQANRDYVFAYAEFGAYNILRTIAGLRAENQAHFWGQPDSPGTQRVKARLKELLCPASIVWRQKVLEQGIALIDNAVLHLADDR